MAQLENEADHRLTIDDEEGEPAEREETHNETERFDCWRYVEAAAIAAARAHAAGLTRLAAEEQAARALAGTAAVVERAGGRLERFGSARVRVAQVAVGVGG